LNDIFDHPNDGVGKLDGNEPAPINAANLTELAAA
jgi:hypothetical protein